jgi:hypothetical protein
MIDIATNSSMECVEIAIGHIDINGWMFQ